MYIHGHGTLYIMNSAWSHRQTVRERWWMNDKGKQQTQQIGKFSWSVPSRGIKGANRSYATPLLMSPGSVNALFPLIHERRSVNLVVNNNCGKTDVASLGQWARAATHRGQCRDV